MELLLIVGLVLLAGLLWVWWRKRAPRNDTKNGRGKGRAAMEGLDTLMSWHPQATRVMTAPERKAFMALRAGLPEHIILAQVPLARFLKVPTRHSYSEWLRRVGVLCGDIVVCDSVSQVIAIVDIRPPESQENDRARQRHLRMDRVLKAAEIPLHVWREDALPNAVGARNAILGSSADAPAPAAAKVGRGVPAAAPRAPVGPRETAVVVEDDGMEHRDPPSSTWFDEMDSAAAPLAPMPPRGSGPSIR
jgi:hypothetical protein